MQTAHTYWMNKALELATLASQCGEVPVGAVVVHDNALIGQGHNQPIAGQDATAHAEVCAIRDACRNMNNYRLTGATLYCTLEPCAMCAGAILNARIGYVVYGAKDLRAGALQTLFQVFDHPELTHQVSYEGGVMADESAQLLRAFFRARRQASL